MKREKVFMRLAAIVLSAVMIAAWFPFTDIGEKAWADDEYPDKVVFGLCTDPIHEPLYEFDYDSQDWETLSWSGSFVYFGKYNGVPIQFRVLDPETTIYGGSTLFLDCDSVLYYASYDNDGATNAGAKRLNEWAYSDIKAGMNGSAFLTKSNGLTDLERNAIASSKIAGHELTIGSNPGDVSGWTYGSFYYYVPLTGEKVFLLDAQDVSNTDYGYPNGEDNGRPRAKFIYDRSDIVDPVSYWLRSEFTVEDPTYGNTYTNGYIYESGPISYGDDRYEDIAVSPAMNIDRNQIIFSSLVTGTEGRGSMTFTLTLADSNMEVGVSSGKNVVKSGSKIMVPYTVSGSNASKATQVSVLILDRPYTKRNTNGAQILFYDKMQTSSSTFSKSGTGTFNLPDELNMSGWNKDYYVYMLAEDINGKYETDYASVPVKLSAPGYPGINKPPINQSVPAGSKANFSISAVGTGTLKYQWQSRKDSSTAWVNSGQSGAKTANLSVSTNAGLDGYQFRCIVTDGNGNQTISDTARLYIVLTITKQPTDVTVAAGSTAKFSVAATGKPNVTYQWQSRKNSSTAWVNSGQSGAKTANLSVATNAGLNGYQFRCIIKDGKGTQKISNTVTLKIGTLKITTQPTSTSVLPGATAKYTVAASGTGTLTYQWQSRKDSSTAWVNSGQSGAKSATLSVATNAGLHGYQFRCVVKDSLGNQKISNTVSLWIGTKITKQPANTSVKAGATATFTVAATGGQPLMYQWQSRKNSSSAWVNSGQSGAKTATLSVATNAGLNGYQFRCIVFNAKTAQVISNSATLTVTK